MAVNYTLVFLSTHGLVGRVSGSQIWTVYQYLDRPNVYFLGVIIKWLQIS